MDQITTISVYTEFYPIPRNGFILFSAYYYDDNDSDCYCRYGFAKIISPYCSVQFCHQSCCMELEGNSLAVDLQGIVNAANV
jgi:hypothetical protein